MGKQIVNQHVYRQWRHDHNRGLVGCPLHRNGLTVQLDEILGQRRIVAQADKSIGMERLKRRLSGLDQTGGSEDTVEGIAGIEGRLPGNACRAVSS